MQFRTIGTFLAMAAALSSNSPAATMLVTYHPTHMRVARVLHGSCWTGSIAAPRRDAFRCMVGNDIYDPCFEQNARRVACPTDVRADRGIAVDVSSLPQNPVNAPASAWAMELQNNASCGAITGAGIAGYPYGCTGPLMCTAPHEIHSSYVVTCIPENAKGAGHARVYRVTRIWY
jgi:hypothetical protein